MRKKILALSLATILACGMCVTAYAANKDAAEATTETETVEFTEVTYDESAFDGEWVAQDGGFEIYVPTDWEQQELDDDQIERGLSYFSRKSDKSMNVVVEAKDKGLTADASLEDIKNALAEEDGVVVQDGYYDVNGISCVGFKSDDDNSEGFCMLGATGIIYAVVTSGTANGDDCKTTCEAILASIRLADSDASAEEGTTEK